MPRRATWALIAVAACHGTEAAPAPPPRPAAAPPANAAVLDASVLAVACDGRAHALGPGVSAERWAVDASPAIASPDGCLDLVRIDLGTHALRILAAAREPGARPAPAWVHDFGLVAAINLAMFMDDGRPVALAVDAAGALRGADNPKFGGFLAFDPVRAGDAPLAVAGRDCPGFDLAALRARYRAVVQSYRLLGCDGGAIGWQDPKAYSAAAVGVDRDGRAVLIHVRAPYTMRQLSAALARPALRLAGALFVEGGPEASLVVRAHGEVLERVGSYETGFVERDDNHDFWDLPNVLGVVAR